MLSSVLYIVSDLFTSELGPFAIMDICNSNVPYRVNSDTVLVINTDGEVRGILQIMNDLCSAHNDTTPEVIMWGGNVNCISRADAVNKVNNSICSLKANTSWTSPVAPVDRDTTPPVPLDQDNTPIAPVEQDTTPASEQSGSMDLDISTDLNLATSERQSSGDTDFFNTSNPTTTEVTNSLN